MDSNESTFNGFLTLQLQDHDVELFEQLVDDDTVQRHSSFEHSSRFHQVAVHEHYRYLLGLYFYLLDENLNLGLQLSSSPLYQLYSSYHGETLPRYRSLVLHFYGSIPHSYSPAGTVVCRVCHGDAPSACLVPCGHLLCYQCLVTLQFFATNAIGFRRQHPTLAVRRHCPQCRQEVGAIQPLNL